MGVKILRSGSDGNYTEEFKESLQKFLKSIEIDRFEKWEKVDDYNYWISNYGRIVHYTNINHFHLLKQTNSKGGYFSFVLRSGGKHKSCRIHRLVAEYFIPNPLNKHYVNHIDGNKQNNKYTNLEWCTQKENFEHAKRIGLWKYNHPYKCKPVYQYDLNGNFIQGFANAASAGIETNVCSRNILQVANKDEFNKEKHSIRKQAGGYVWSFEKKDKININGGDKNESENTK